MSCLPLIVLKMKNWFIEPILHVKYNHLSIMSYSHVSSELWMHAQGSLDSAQ